MRYMLMMHVSGGTGGVQFPGAALEEFTARVAHLRRVGLDLAASGEWVDGHELTPPGQATLVRAGEDGAPVTDRAFAEAKEYLAGYWIVDVDGPERALRVAARISAVPGPGGVPANVPVEVRRFMSDGLAPEVGA